MPRLCGCCDSKVGFEAISSPMQPMQTLWLHGSVRLLGQGKFEVVASEKVACTGAGNALFDC